MVDAADLKSASRKRVGVRVPSWAPLFPPLPSCLQVLLWVLFETNLPGPHSFVLKLPYACQGPRDYRCHSSLIIRVA